MTYPKVCLRRGEETGVRAGKPWTSLFLFDVYGNLRLQM